MAVMPDCQGSEYVRFGSQGGDPASVTDDAFDGAISALEEAVDSGQIRRFTGNDYTRDMANEDAVAVIGWSGDAVQLQADNPLIFPDDATLANLYPYVDLDEDEERQMNEAMQAVVGA